MFYMSYNVSILGMFKGKSILTKYVLNMICIMKHYNTQKWFNAVLIKLLYFFGVRRVKYLSSVL